MKKKGNVFVYMVLVAAVLLTKVLGLVRGMLINPIYGMNGQADAFYAVTSLPLILFDVTFGTAITSAFVPVFNEKLTKEGEMSANRFASNFLTIVSIFVSAIVLLGILFPQFAVMMVASGFKDNTATFTLASQLMRIIMPIMFFACCTFIFIGILQSYGEFIAPALVSLFSNLTMILYLVFLNRYFGLHGLAVAFCVGWGMQLLFLIPFLRKKRFKYTFAYDLKSPDIKKVAILTLPLFVAALAQPINQLISTNLSSGVAEGGLSIVNTAYNAYLIVAGVFSYALTNMFFPEMSRRFANNDVDGATVICRTMLSNITAIIMPMMVFLSVCAGPVIKVLYERGEFTPGDTARVAALLMIYAFGMVFLSWQDILNKYFYSMQKSFVPMIAAAVGIGVNLLLALLLSHFYGLRGLAIATVVAGVVMTLVLSAIARKFTKLIFTGSFFLEIGKVLLCGAITAAVCRLLLGYLPFDGTVVMQVLSILVCFISALIVYLVALYAVRSENFSAIAKLLKKEEKNSDAL